MILSLNRGFTVEIDDADFPLVRGYKWRVDCGRYARTNVTVCGRQRPLMMHRLILGLSFGDGQFTDHVDGNGLNNTRRNLRVCTHAQNMRNRKTSVRSATGLKGVYRHHRGVRFEARIAANGRRMYLGGFATAQEASAAYARASAQFHGEFGRVA